MTSHLTLWGVAAVMVGAVLLGSFARRWLAISAERVRALKKQREYLVAIARYRRLESPQAEDFSALQAAGEAYFDYVKSLCETILSGRAPGAVRDGAWLPHIRVAFEQTLPEHYDLLAREAAARGFPAPGKLRRGGYEGMYAVAEKFSHTAGWAGARGSPSLNAYRAPTGEIEAEEQLK